MNVDQQGFLWLSNPWIVTLTLIVVTGAVVRDWATAYANGHPL